MKLEETVQDFFSTWAKWLKRYKELSAIEGMTIEAIHEQISKEGL